jgi:hypothetical protein
MYPVRVSFFGTFARRYGRRWVQSDDVGIYAAVPVGNDGKAVQIILEKDFPCLHGDPGEQSGRFDDLANQ